MAQPDQFQEKALYDRRWPPCGTFLPLNQRRGYTYCQGVQPANTTTISNPQQVPGLRAWWEPTIGTNFRTGQAQNDIVGFNDGSMVPANWTNQVLYDLTNLPPNSPYDGALRFDGDNDFIDFGSITLGHPLMLFNVPFTISVWFRWDPAGGDTFKRIVDKSDGGGYQNGWGIHVHTDGSVAWAVGGNTEFETTTGRVAPGPWYHLVVSKPLGLQGTMWIDGAIPVMANGANRTMTNAVTNARIGSWNHATAREWQGTISDFRIYPQTMTAAEVQWLFSYGTLGTAPATTPVFHVPLNGQDPRNGDKIYAWKSVSNFVAPEAVQVDGSFMPVYTTNVQNGFPALDFPAVDGELQSLGGPWGTRNPPFTVFGAGQITTVDAGQNQWMCRGSGLANQGIGIFKRFTGNWGVHAGAPVGIEGGPVDTNWHVHNQFCDTPNDEHFIDGALNAIGNAGNDPIQGVTIGNQVTDGEGWGGFIGELVFYGRRLTTMERTQLQNNYFGPRWL